MSKFNSTFLQKPTLIMIDLKRNGRQPLDSDLKICIKIHKYPPSSILMYQATSSTHRTQRLMEYKY